MIHSSSTAPSMRLGLAPGPASAPITARAARPHIVRALALMALVLCPSGPQVAAQTTFQWISQGPAGEASEEFSAQPEFSANGRYICFYDRSDSWYLPLNQGTVWRRDLTTGDVVVCGLDSTGALPSNDASSGVPLDDGRVLFSSNGADFAPGDRTTDADLYLRDPVVASFEAVSVDSSEMHLNGSTDNDSAVSDDGRFVIWATEEALDPLDLDGAEDLYMRDTVLGVTVNLTPSDDDAGSSFGEYGISGDGIWIAFGSDKDTLVSGDTNGWDDVFLLHRETSAITRLSLDAQGQQLDTPSDFGDINDDGRYVAWYSLSPDVLDPPVAFTVPDGFPDLGFDIFIYRTDTITGDDVLVSQGTGGRVSPILPSARSRISDDGQRVAMTLANASWFNSAEGLFHPSSANDANSHVYVRDIAAGTTTLVDALAPGVVSSGRCTDGLAIDGAGENIAFSSYAEDLVAGDSNGQLDIYMTSATPDQPWTLVGPSLYGDGFPLLNTRGLPADGEPVQFELRTALPDAMSYLVLGVTQIGAPFKLGVLGPSPDFITPLMTDGSGEWTLPFTWPDNIPAGTSIYLQVIMPDAGAPAGWALSNTVRGVAQDS